MEKLQPPLKKATPSFQQPPSEILRHENWDPVKPGLFENLFGGSTPRPQQKGGGCTLWCLFELKDNDTTDMSTII